MSLSPLKFSFGISLLVHGLVLGGVPLLGKFERAPAVVVVGDATTLELIAAPVSVLQPSVATPVAPASIPMATPAPPLQPPEETIPEKAPEPPRVEHVLLPLPPPVRPVTESQLIAQAVIPMTGFVTAPEPTPAPSDNSSPTPGQDITTVPGSPTAQAKPDYLKNPEPEYPIQARRRGQEGLVLLNVTVSGFGRAIEVSLKQSSGYDLLDQAAIKAVQAWEFDPARIGSVGVESKIEVPVRFKLTR